MSEFRLLVIEDDRDIANLVCRVAAEMDFEVHAVHHFKEIPSLYDKFAPHVIVLDIVMPEMDGFEVLNFLYRRHSATRIIILSGQPGYRPMASRMGEGLELAVDAIMAKPFRIAELRKTLENIKHLLAKPDEDAASQQCHDLA